MNEDLTQLAITHTSEMEWTPSPGGQVLRKRVYLSGDSEKGAVSSVVRYPPGSVFPRHEHPAGEEILVLQGTFSDEHGDFPAGTYLLNPPGSHHAPSSREGCTIFVRLRQYDGEGRRELRVNTNSPEAWQPHPELESVSICPLYANPDSSEEMRLVRLAPDTTLGSSSMPQGREIFVVSGAFSDEYGDYRKGSWVRHPAGCQHSPRSSDGCTLLVREGHLA